MLPQNEKTIWRAIDGIQNEYERELMLNYKTALTKIRLSMGRIYERYAEKGILTHAEMTKFNRLDKLTKNISGIMGPMFSKNGRLVDRLTKVQYEEMFFRYGWAIEQEAKVNLNWGLLNPKTIEEAVKNDLALIAKQGLRQDGLLGIRRTVVQGLIRGDSYPKMARKIKKFIDRSASGYMTIARTEGQRAAVLGQIAQADKSEELGITINRIWDATLDGSTRPEHQAMDGRKAGKDGMFDTPVGPVAGPLQSGDPAFDINCRCRLREEIEEYKPDIRRIRGEGFQEYIKYDDWDKARKAA